jgi:MraZ protein
VFVGTFEHSLDEKGRLVMPSAFRHRLADGGVLAPWDRCLALWTTEEFEKVAQIFKEKVAVDAADDDAADALRSFLADASHVKPDNAGRIGISPSHRESAGLTREAVVVGGLNHIEIWDRGTWEDLQTTSRSNVARVVKAMRL